MTHAVVGTGYWGSNHVRASAELAANGELDDVVLCDVDEERVAEMASSYDVSYTLDHNDLVEMDVDTATVATPSPVHHRIATTLLDGGVDVLVEKPLALTSEEAWDIVATAEENDCTLGVGHIFRYHPALRALKERIDRGEFGQIETMYSTRFAFRAPRATAGSLYSLAVHDVDISNYLLDDSPDQLFCSLESHVRDDTDEAATLVLDYGDARSVITESWRVPVFDKRRDLVVVGSEKVGYVDYLQDTTVEVFESRVEREGGTLVAREDGSREYEVPDEEPLKGEIRAFFDASRNGTDPVASGRIGAEAVETLELAERSAETFDSVAVPDATAERVTRR